MLVLSESLNMLGDYESSDEDTGPNLPAGVLRSRGGWADANNLEIEHQRERLRAAEDGGVDGERSAHAAVDLSQFRNEEVGKGYKAKHVVRQREAAISSTELVDKSGGKFSKKEAGSKKRRRDDGEKGNDGSKSKQAKDTTTPLESYLACKGMRDFMKEVDKILKQR